MRIVLASLLAVWLPIAAVAADRSQATAAVSDAVGAEAAAARLGNRWVPTEAALKAARAALAAQSWDIAVTQAARARLLAERAVAQSNEQKTAWHDAVIR